MVLMSSSTSSFACFTAYSFNSFRASCFSSSASCSASSHIFIYYIKIILDINRKIEIN